MKVLFFQLESFNNVFIDDLDIDKKNIHKGSIFAYISTKE